VCAEPPKADIAEGDWHVLFVPKADIVESDRDVRFVPKADILHCGKRCRYSIASSAFRTPEPLVNLAEMGLVRAQSARNLHRRV
jgi:hypothetical protein